MTDRHIKELTGLPSIDKPWLKYYSEEAIHSPLPEMTMYQYIWENNREYLSDVALRYYGTKITYGKLFEIIKKAASAFYAMGVRPGDIVTIMSMHTPETICAMYALNYIGAVANMVYLTLAEKEILQTLENTGSKMFLVLDVALDRVNRIKNSISVPVVVMGIADSFPVYLKLGYRLKAKPEDHGFLNWKEFLAKAGTPAPAADDHAAPAVIVYTSGSTGEPKGVVLGNDQLNAAVFQLLQSSKNYQRTDTFLSIIPPFLSYGILMLHEGLTIGLTSILWLNHESNGVAKELVRQKIIRFAGSPDCVDALMRLGKINLSQLVDYTGGGDKLSPSKEVEINNFFRKSQASTKYLPAYGMTEFSACVALTTNETYKPQSVGVPLPSVNVKCMDLNSKCEVSFNIEGEIYVSGPNLMQGFFKNAVATNEVIEADENGIRWLHTGDIGYIDEDGFLYITGRLKRTYFTKGSDGAPYRLFPQRIEEFIESIQGIGVCGVVAQEDAVKVNVPVAYITVNDKTISTNAIKDRVDTACKDELPEHLRPVEIHIIDRMPMTVSGKIDYRALEKLAEEEKD